MRKRFEIYVALAIAVIAFSTFLATEPEPTGAYITTNLPATVQNIQGISWAEWPNIWTTTIIAIARTAPQTTGCGNGICEGGEGCQTCSIDCACVGGQACQNNQCAATVAPASCGNGICEATENCGNCLSDCQCQLGAACWNSVCVTREWVEGETCTSLGSLEHNIQMFTTITSGQPFAFNPYKGAQIRATDFGFGVANEPNFGTQSFNDYCEDGQTLVKFACTKNLRITSSNPSYMSAFAIAGRVDCQQVTGQGGSCREYQIQGGIGNVAACVNQGPGYTFAGTWDVGQDMIILDYTDPSPNNWRYIHLEYNSIDTATGSVQFTTRGTPFPNVITFAYGLAAQGNLQIVVQGNVYTATVNPMTGTITPDFCAQVNPSSQVWCVM